jgi:hypothetical protein
VLQVSKERVAQEVEQMLRSKNHARAVCLFHYIELVPLILPLPPIENICLATFSESLSNSSTANSTSSSSSGGGISTVVAEDLGDKKKKKKGNNDAEVVYNLSPQDIAFIAESTRDFHSYGCCASLIQALLERSASTVSDGYIRPVSSEICSKGREYLIKEILDDSFDAICDEMKGFLYHFYKDLSKSQSEETGKILRFVLRTYALYLIANKIGTAPVSFNILIT